LEVWRKFFSSTITLSHSTHCTELLIILDFFLSTGCGTFLIYWIHCSFVWVESTIVQRRMTLCAMWALNAIMLFEAHCTLYWENVPTLELGAGCPYCFCVLVSEFTCILYYNWRLAVYRLDGSRKWGEKKKVFS